MATNSTTDGLGFDEVNQAVTSTETISGTNVYAKTSSYAGGKLLSPVGTGSPTTWGLGFQAGSGATAGGSNAWVSFGTAFSGVPVSVNTVETETAGEWSFAPIGSWSAGSFYVETKSATKAFSWNAAGAL